MAKSLNKVELIGNVGTDPEVRHTPNGDEVVSFSIATSVTWKDKNTGEKREHTEWHRCVGFGAIAGIIGRYIVKGSRIYIEGALKTRDYEQDGVKKYITEIKVRDVIMLDKPDMDRPSVSQQDGHNTQQSAPAPAAANTSQHQAPSFDDDIPF